jgi:hypothetical protein
MEAWEVITRHRLGDRLHKVPVDLAVEEMELLTWPVHITPAVVAVADTPVAAVEMEHQDLQELIQELAAAVEAHIFLAQIAVLPQQIQAMDISLLKI